jgi:transposase
MIRSVKLTNKFANPGKAALVSSFLAEYRRVACYLVDFYWENGLYSDGKVFCVEHGEYQFPAMLKKEDLPKGLTTFLSARALKCLSTQVCGIINGLFSKRKKQLFIKQKLEKEGKNVPVGLLKKIDGVLSKPDCSNINAEINSICCDFVSGGKHFDGFVSLFSLRNDMRGQKIHIPLKFHRNYHKWAKIGTPLKSFLISDNNIHFRFEVKTRKNSGVKIVGADQGLKTILTLSNGEVTPGVDRHGNSLNSICSKLARKKRGSKAFGRAQEHRKNFINWSINQLNFNDIKQINLEKVVNINFGKRASRKMQAWTNTEIRDKVISRAKEHDVRVVLQDCTYRSQRCSCCGSVRKTNRKGKKYECKNCGNTMDADLNAAKNHEIYLPPLPWWIRSKKLNIKDGFFWNPNGIFNFDREALTVPLPEK